MCINMSLSTFCSRDYQLNEWVTGAMYLLFGVGGIVATCFTSWFIDWARRKYMRFQDLSTNTATADNPWIEKARLSIIWTPVLLISCLVPLVGWGLQLHWVYNTLLSEINPEAPAATQASSDMVRGTLSAIVVGCLEYMEEGIGTGWTFTFMGGFYLVALGLLTVEYHKGASWRQKINRTTEEV
ncbi:hypothetical protein B0O99DRAFT_748657 [Bisporella sp. PMI_857]|nr:hypothetical protein B0O99DRAFT_748657 [Bisporella sp. PMI_857]